MTPVALPYCNEGSCNFDIFFEFDQYPSRGYVHEFRPSPPMQEWLNECGCSYHYKTICTRSMMTHMEVIFEDPNVAMLFKLTWA